MQKLFLRLQPKLGPKPIYGINFTVVRSPTRAQGLNDTYMHLL